MRCLSSAATPLAFALLLLAVVWISTPATSTPTPDGPNGGNTPRLDRQVSLPCEKEDGSPRANGTYCYGYFGDSVLSCTGDTIYGTIVPRPTDQQNDPSSSGWQRCQEVSKGNAQYVQASLSDTKKRFPVSLCQLFEGLKGMDRGHDHDHGDSSSQDTSASTVTASGALTVTGDPTDPTVDGDSSSGHHNSTRTYCVGLAGKSTVTCPGDIVTNCDSGACQSPNPMDGQATCAAPAAGAASS